MIGERIKCYARSDHFRKTFTEFFSTNIKMKPHCKKKKKIFLIDILLVSKYWKANKWYKLNLWITITIKEWFCTDVVIKTTQIYKQNLEYIN